METRRMSGEYQFRRRIFKPKRRGRGFRRIVGAVVVALILLAVSLAIIEAAVRLLPRSRSMDSAIFEFRPEYLYALKPGSSGVYTIETADGEKTISLDVSEQGIRDHAYGPKAADEFRILMLGDSRTMGLAVAVDDAVPSVVERAFARNPHGKKITVINAGIPGFGPVQERDFLNDRGFLFEPDLVVVQLYAGDDLANALEYEGRHLRAYSPEREAFLDSFRQEQSFSNRCERWMMTHSVAYERLRSFRVPWISVSGFIEKIPGVPVWVPPNRPQTDLRHPGHEPDLIDWYPELDEAIGLVKEGMRGLRADCAARNIDVIVYVQPDIASIMTGDPFGATIEVETPPTIYDYGKGVRVLEAFLVGDAIEHIVVTGPLADRGYPSTLFDSPSGHMTVLGNKVVAKLIHHHLESVYFPKKFGGLPIASREAS